MQVWKVQIPLDTGVHEITLPRGAVIISAKSPFKRSRIISIWAMVYPELPQETREIEVAFTGKDLVSVGCTPIATIQTHEPYFVWHVFEVIK